MSTDPMSKAFLKNILSHITNRISVLRDRKKQLLGGYRSKIEAKEIEQIRKDILEQ